MLAVYVVVVFVLVVDWSRRCVLLFEVCCRCRSWCRWLVLFVVVGCLVMVLIVVAVVCVNVAYVCLLCVRVFIVVVCCRYLIVVVASCCC